MQVLDDRNVRRRFRASSMTCSTKIRPLVCSLPLKLTDGWNEIQINLIELTQRAYATNYIEATRLQVGLGYTLNGRRPQHLTTQNSLLPQILPNCTCLEWIKSQISESVPASSPGLVHQSSLTLLHRPI